MGWVEGFIRLGGGYIDEGRFWLAGQSLLSSGTGLGSSGPQSWEMPSTLGDARTCTPHGSALCALRLHLKPPAASCIGGKAVLAAPCAPSS